MLKYQRRGTIVVLIALSAIGASHPSGGTAAGQAVPGRDGPGTAGQEVKAAEGEVMRGVMKVVITRRNALREGPREYSETVTDPKKVEGLASFFPGLGQGKPSPVAAQRPTLARIEFSRTGKEPVTVHVDPQLDVWSEEHGEWRLSPDFRAFFVDLLQDHPGVEWPGEPYSHGTTPKVIKATITRYPPLAQGTGPQVTELDDPAALQKLAAFFPGAGQGRESPIAGAWESAAKIEFARRDQPPLTVKVDDHLSSWSEGQGTWRLRPEFRDLFLKLAAPARH